MDRPILFSAPMIRALLDGRKTQTRRVLKNQPPTVEEVRARSGSGYHWFARRPGDREWSVAGPVWAVREITGENLPKLAVPYAIGDRLWVKETWRTSKVADELAPRMLVGGGYSRIWYEADRDNCDQHGKVRVSIHMPRWASRLTLIVTDVRVQRLNDCSEEDAIAEGCVWDAEKFGFWVPGADHPNKDFPYLANATARGMYAALWDVINGSGEWLANPWVVAVAFEVERRNIDQIGGR